MVTDDGQLYLYDDDQLIAEVKGDVVTNHPEYLASYTKSSMESVSYFGGRWPDNAYLRIDRPEQRSGYSVLFKKSGKRWKQVARTQVAEWAQGVKPWDRGRKIALISAMYGYYRWEVVEGTPRTVPAPARAGANACCGPQSVAEMPVDFVALPTGDLFAVGAKVDENSVWVVEHWKPGKTNGTLVPLPVPKGDGLVVEVTGLYASTERDVFAFGRVRKLRADSFYEQDFQGGYLAHYDGISWSLVPGTESFEISSVAREGETLWLVAGGRLMKKEPSDPSFVLVPLPEMTEPLLSDLYNTKPPPGPWKMTATSVVVRDGHDIWVNAQGAKPGSLTPPLILRNRPHRDIWRGLGDKDYEQTMEQYKAFRPADEYCTSIYVMLYGMTKSTPKNYDYPLTREALKGHTEFSEVIFAETEELGKHYFGAFVPNLEVSKKLVKLLTQKVEGSKPVALCRNPKKVRILEFDFKTGSVLKNEPIGDGVTAK
jgi:hypothetical protein